MKVVDIYCNYDYNYSRKEVYNMEEKRCPRCKETKPISDFGIDRRNKDGHNLYCKACKKLYNDEQKEYRSAYMKKWHQEHPKAEENFERDREYSRQYRQTHKETCRQNNRRYYERMISAGDSVTVEEIEKCLSFFKGECAYSGIPLTQEYHLDHVVPVSKGGKNNISNRVPCLPIINLQKSVKDFETWYPSQSFYSEQRYIKIKEWMEKGEV